MPRIPKFNKKIKNTSKQFLVDKKADITTNNGGFYHIRKNRVYICGLDYYGKVYTISSNKYNKRNLHVIKEIYPYDDKRLRFLIVNFKNAKKFKTIEKLPNGSERKVAVIEKFDDKSEYICSIGDIKNISSDLMEFDYKQNNKIKPVESIKKLILKPEEYIDKKKNKRRD
ncbi:MAG: hypothetical protein IIZ40_01685 [Bacilli bacterium]|nr:hypothetical protein [Bacilli bacterium]